LGADEYGRALKAADLAPLGESPDEVAQVSHVAHRDAGSPRRAPRPPHARPRGVAVSGAWATVLLVGVATVAIKAAGPVFASGRELPGGAARVLDLLAPALLAALVATQAFATGESLVLDERAAGLMAGGVAVWLRAPLLMVIVVAAATAAGLRALT